MGRKLGIGLVVGGVSVLGLMSTLHSPGAETQKTRDDSPWIYKVAILSYNPGERLTDEQRALAFERTLNEQARQGWEPVGSLLTRDSVQTVGGAVTTRETTAFVAYRRRR